MIKNTKKSKIKYNYHSKIKWDELLDRLKTQSNLINRTINDAVIEAKQLQSRIELEVNNSEVLFQSLDKDANNNNMSEEFDEPDTLVLQEFEDLDGNDVSSIGERNRANYNKPLLEKYREIEKLTKNSLMLDSIKTQFKVGECFKDFIETVSRQFSFLKGSLDYFCSYAC